MHFVCYRYIDCNHVHCHVCAYFDLLVWCLSCFSCFFTVWCSDLWWLLQCIAMDLKRYLSFDQSKQHFYQCISLLPAVRTMNVAPTTVYNNNSLKQTKKTAYFHLQVAWGLQYYGSFLDCRWKHLGSKGPLGTLSWLGTTRPEKRRTFTYSYFICIIHFHFSYFFFSISRLSKIYFCQIMMLTHVFDRIISFYSIFLPLHRKVPDTK